MKTTKVIYRIAQPLRLLLLTIFCTQMFTAAHAQRDLLAQVPWENGTPGVIAKWQPAQNGEPRLLRLTVETANPQMPWLGQIAENLAASPRKGHNLVFSFRARSQAKNTLLAVVEKNGEPYTKELFQTLSLSAEWKTYTFPFALQNDYPANGLGAKFQVGTATGVIEIADIKLIDNDLPPAKAAPPVGANLLDDTTPYILGGASPDSARLEKTADNIYRIHLEKLPANTYDVSLRHAITYPILNRQTLRLRFRARSISASTIRAVFEQDSAPYTKSLELIVALTPEWKEFALPFRTVSGYDPDASTIAFHLGFKVGTIEITDIRLENYGVTNADLPASIGQDWYGGIAHDDKWRAAADTRIDRIRKGNLRLRVVDANGKPIRDATVKVNQTRHAFRWGTAISPVLLSDSTDGEKYRAAVKHLFNYAVFDNNLKWEIDDFTVADKMLTWCATNNIPVRGHCLFWPAYQYLPQSVKNLRGAAMHTAVEAHIHDYVRRAKGRVVVWDVINEAVANTEVTADAGRDLLWNCFKWAREEDPTVPLCYNDYDISNNPLGANTKHRANVISLVRELQAHNAPVTEIGDQAHIGIPLTPAPDVLAAWDDYSRLGLPIEITEFDAVVTDDTAHAKYMDDFMTAAFSQPNIKSFVMWGFWQGSHWLGDKGGAMIRRDWSLRPGAVAYENLVFHKWWTSATGATNDDGIYQTRAFLGTHRVDVTIGGKTKTVNALVSKNGDGTETVTVRL